MDLLNNKDSTASVIVRFLLVSYSLIALATTFSPLSDDLKLPIVFPFIFLISGYSLVNLFHLNTEGALEKMAYSFLLGLAFVPGINVIFYILTDVPANNLTIISVSSFVLLIFSLARGRVIRTRFGDGET
jgi:hypothetical protein